MRTLRTAVLFSLLFTMGISDCAAQTKLNIKGLDDLIAAKKYDQAALQNIQLYSEASKSKPSKQEFHALQDSTLKLITILLKNKKVADAERVSQWQDVTATKLFGPESAEKSAALQDAAWVVRAKTNSFPAFEKVSNQQMEIMSKLAWKGERADVFWLNDRNKPRLNKSINESFASVEASLKKLEREFPEMAPKRK